YTHTHLIRGGLSFNLELRWNAVPILADALRMLREQAPGSRAEGVARGVAGGAARRPPRHPADRSADPARSKPPESGRERNSGAARCPGWATDPNALGCRNPLCDRVCRVRSSSSIA